MNVVTFYGRSGTPYVFELFPMRTLFDEVGGVYVLCKPADGARWEAIEIGIAENLRDGVSHQDENLRRRFPDATNIAVIASADPDQRTRIHGDLLAAG